MADPFRTLSLDALRGFEAAARHLSFTAAAESLSLTQSAVSKQVKQLENAIGKPLFTRGARGLSLTPEGRQLYAGARESLAQLQALVDRLAQRERQSVSVSVTPSFASLWLAPRLAGWRDEHPALDLRVDAAEGDVALEREGFDLAVRLSAPERAGAHWKLLACERALLVAAPAVAARIRNAGDLAHETLLVFHHPVERFPALSWSGWHERLGLDKTATQPVLQFSQYEHVVKAAVAGAGVAIGRTPLVLPLLRTGQLEVVLPGHAVDGLGYYLLVSERAAARPEVQAVASWIERELAAEALG
jgi:DNA-binding transcriptional LysR family regulator